MITAQLYRPAWMPALLVMALLLMVALGLLVAMATRSLARLQPVHGHVAQLRQLQQATQRLDLLVLKAASGHAPLDRAGLAAVADELTKLLGHTREADRRILKRLSSAAQGTDMGERQAIAVALAAREHLSALLIAETHVHDELIKNLDQNTRMELKVASGLIVGFPLLGLVVP
jgi:hypothetical protein